MIKSRRVLHVVDTFGARSQTFIYTYVTNHASFQPQVVCRQRDLVAEFPFEPLTILPETWSRWHPSRWWSLLALRMGRLTPWQRRVEHAVSAAVPDVLHAHFGQVALRILPAMRSLNIPLITSFYGYDASGFAGTQAARAAFPELFRTGALFLAEGPVMRARLIALGAPEDRVRVVPIAIDLSKYPSWTKAQGAPFVLFVARFVEKKGLPDAIAAFAAARHAHPQLTMRVIGDGPEEARARVAAATHGVADAIEWLGPRPHAECLDYMRTAAVLIQPSVTAEDGDTEGGAPTTLIEAQAIGTPIVATTHADIPHVAPHGGGIHLAAEHDVTNLAAGIVRLVRSPIRSDSAGVKNRHDVRHVIPQLERCYLEALENARRRAA